jgi:hypothetical protein
MSQRHFKGYFCAQKTITEDLIAQIDILCNLRGVKFIPDFSVLNSVSVCYVGCIVSFNIFNILN